ncbi:hypothetical protein Tco_0683313 [Tanacetum coccineum]|uniref:Uncharacterized protein n=1 Tax=Tanacetum coccineum TaxID=301880 RepID=A0ABQ4XVJ8_9ASTR
MSTLTFADTHNMFWATAKATTTNGERQLQALIDKKKVIIMETSIRSDLHLEDAGAFFSPQWKFLIHTITQCLSAKSTAWNEFSSTMDSLIICLATNQKFNLSKYIFDAMVKHLDGGVKFLISQKKQSRRKQRKDTAVTQEEPQQDVSVPTPSNDPPISEKANVCSKQRKIADLKKKVQKLGRSIEDIDKDADVSLVDDTYGRSDDANMFDTNDLHGDEVNVDMPVGEKQEQSAKEREEPSEFRTPQESQPSMIKDKGKSIMIEPEVPLKRKDQVALDEDLARNLQA